MQEGRSCGIFVPLASLPSPYGSGGFGDEARQFIDFLKGNGLTHWQLLPFAYAEHGISPYESIASRAFHHLYLDPEHLVAEKLLTKAQATPPSTLHDDWVSLAALRWKHKLCAQAYQAFTQGKAKHLRAAYEAFLIEESDWIIDFALFVALSARFNKTWQHWPKEYRDPGSVALLTWEREHRSEVEQELFAQFLLRAQWQDIKQYAHMRGIQIIGDLPIYSPDNSFEVWNYRKNFVLHKDGFPHLVSGAPPDALEPNGQRWGTPLYNWKELEKSGYTFMLERIEHATRLFDILRIDHYLGYVRAWAIPTHKKPKAGDWIATGGEKFFTTLKKRIPANRFILEDLGKNTRHASRIRLGFGAPNIRVLSLELAKGNTPEECLNFQEPGIGYTSTHDTETIVGWYCNASPKMHTLLDRWWKKEGVEHLPLQQRFITPLLRSKAPLVILSLQDILGMGNTERINIPGTSGSKNWSWRFSWKDIDKLSLDALGHALEVSKRKASL